VSNLFIKKLCVYDDDDFDEKKNERTSIIVQFVFLFLLPLFCCYQSITQLTNLSFLIFSSFPPLLINLCPLFFSSAHVYAVRAHTKINLLKKYIGSIISYFAITCV
jgi:hypothetical protein